MIEFQYHLVGVDSLHIRLTEVARLERGPVAFTVAVFTDGEPSRPTANRRSKASQRACWGAHGEPARARRPRARRAGAAVLSYAERPAAGAPEGLLVLHHGRGTDEQDLLRMAEEIDPRGRLHIVTPRAPLTVPGSPGYHWYLVPRVGYPDPETFAAARAALAELHDALWERTGLTPAQTVLGGFSMGCVMSYATGLDAARPAPAGILAFSGFIPQVPGGSRTSPSVAGCR